MGKLFQFGSITIRVWGSDHRPPHFHVVGPDDEAMVEIETLDIIAGSIPRSVRKAVMDWARSNREAIVAEWNRQNPDKAI